MGRKKYVACICGHFAFGQDKLNGQTIKTKIVAEELENRFGADNIKKIDTCGGFKALFALPSQLSEALRECDNLIIMPAYKGVRIISFMLMFLRRIYKECTVHYVVIGAWLPLYIRTKFLLKRSIKQSIDYIYSETKTMQKALQDAGMKNVSVMPNCKKLDIISKDSLQTTAEAPYRLCIFSRIMKNKGVEVAVDVLRKINNEAGRTIYSLDIYGPVWEQEKDWFENLQQSFPEYIHYKGVVPFQDSVKVLKGYFALLFPTLFYTEGVPGTIIDAYAAGLPVISARWESYTDVVDESITGYGYRFNDSEEFTDVLKKIAQKPDMIISLKTNCLKKAETFIPQNVLDTLTKNLHIHNR